MISKLKKIKRGAAPKSFSAEGLSAHNIGKFYQKRPILRDVSINVKQGEIVGVLGPNGAGKTTSFYVLCGLVQPDYGTVFLEGRDITSFPMYRRARLGIGYLPQEASVFRGMNVENNILSVLEYIESNPNKREQKLENLLAEFSISHLRQAPAIALSGGERRRVEIARCLAMQPKYVLLDEPLAGIDPISIQDIQNLIFHLKERGIGVLITDHNVREMLKIVDKAYIISDGSILTEGSPEDIITDPEVRRIYLGNTFAFQQE